MTDWDLFEWWGGLTLWQRAGAVAKALERPLAPEEVEKCRAEWSQIPDHWATEVAVMIEVQKKRRR